MDRAYAAADLVVSRSGAMSVAELCVAGKPAIFVPFPFAAEDHQTVNAKKLVDKNAALMIRDSEVMEKLAPLIIETIADERKLKDLSKNISAMGITDADRQIANKIMTVLGSR
jgi:UDP-N-acetylglucosamine--N-acetylmuramyl-(pentapeptide) pyrophosphoryl-undecaprenol N-acetylglucosamine transferase